MDKCLVCGGEIEDMHPRLVLRDRTGSICIGCEFAEMDVFLVTLPGEKNGYYEADISVITEMLKDSDFDSGYTIIRQKMKATEYYNLPEFTGF